MSNVSSVLIYFVIERLIEDEALLLAKSIRTFSDKDNQYRIIAFNPGKSVLSPEIVNELERNGIELQHLRLNQYFDFYPLSNKVFVSSYVEEKYGSEYEILMFLDSDIVVLKPLDELFGNTFKIALKPESDNIVGLKHKESPNLFWQMLYDSANIKPDQSWNVVTTNDNIEIKAFYNSGVVVVKKGGDIFQTWKECFLKSITDKRSFKIDYIKYYFIEQASLSMAIVKTMSKSDVLDLSNDYNYPLNPSDSMSKASDFSNISVLHHHQYLYTHDWTNQFSKSIEEHQWLLNNKPKSHRQTKTANMLASILKFQIFKMRYKYHLLPELDL